MSLNAAQNSAIMSQFLLSDYNFRWRPTVPGSLCANKWLLLCAA